MELWTGIRDMFGTRHVGRGIVRETQNRTNRHTYNNITQALGNTYTRKHTQRGLELMAWDFYGDLTCWGKLSLHYTSSNYPRRDPKGPSCRTYIPLSCLLTVPLSIHYPLLFSLIFVYGDFMLSFWMQNGYFY